MSRKTLSPASVFERVLRAHETGGVTFKDVRAQLKELLAAGASPTELLETLRRQEQWEPLPEPARVEVVGLIDEAIRTAPKNDDAAPAEEATPPSTSTDAVSTGADAISTGANESDEPGLQRAQLGHAGDLTQGARMRRSAPSENVRSLEARIAGQQADYTTLTRSYERAREAESVANTRAAALAAQLAALETTRDADEAEAQKVAATLAETLAANAALHARAEAAVREARDARTEVRTLIESVQGRDASLAEVQKSFSSRDAELAALQQERAQAALLAERSEQDLRGLRDSLRSAESSIVELRDSASQREAAFTALQAEQAKLIAALDSEALKLRQSLSVRDTNLAETQRLLDTRAAELEALRQQGVRSELDLQAARAALADASRSLGEHDVQHEAELQTVRAALAAEQAKSQHATQSLEQSQEELRGLRNSLMVRDSALAEAQRSIQARAAELQASLEQGARTEQDLQAARSALADASRSLGEREALESELQIARSRLTDASQTVGKREAQREAELQAVRAALLAEQSRSQQAAQAVEQSQEELRQLRDSSTARDSALAEAQRGIDAYASELQVLRQQGTRVESDLLAARSALAIANQSVSKRDAQLKSDAAELQSAKAALESERIRAQDMDRAFAERFESADAALARADRSLRETQLHTAEQRRLLESDLSDARMRIDSLTTELANLKAADALRAEPVAVPTPVPTPSPIAMLAPAIPLRVEPRSSAARAARPNRLGVVAAVAVIFLCAVAVYFLKFRAPPSAPVAQNVAPVAPKAGTVIRDCLTCPEITVLPTGKFTQGSAGPGVGPAAFEKPLHVVAINRVIGMATNLVTVDEFKQFVAASGWDSQGCTTYDGEWKARAKNNWFNPGFAQTGKHPVTCASWNDAQAYAKWLSAKAGHTYRLPSASEWEYAARAGGEAVAPWTTEAAACASANVADHSAAHRYPGWAAFDCDDGYVYTSPVGSFKANAFGLNDMLGNVFQWTEDCWHADYVGAPIDGTARTDAPCDEHELRGGSWFTTPAYVRANYRNHFTADYRSSTVGIRLVRDFGA